MPFIVICVFLIAMVATGVAANTKGWIRWISVLVVSIVVLPILAGFLLLVTMEMKLCGIWPFKPLASYHAERPLKNGGALIFDAKEDRSSGMNWNAPPEEEIGLQVLFTASYRPPGSDSVEQIDSTVEGAFPSLEKTEVYFLGELIVVVPSGVAGLYVRSQGEISAKERHLETPDGRSGRQVVRLHDRWRRLSLYYSRLNSPDIRSTFDDTPEADLLKNWTDLREGDVNFSTPKIASFDPATRKVLVTFSTDKRIRRASLQLSEDGSSLSLLEN